MSQTIPIYKNGKLIEHLEFPDGTTDEQIHAAIQKEYPQQFTPVKQSAPAQEVPKPVEKPLSNAEKFQHFTGNDKPSFTSNFAGGMLNSLMDIGKAFPDLHNMVPESMQKAIPYKKGESPINKFDAYKAMGTKNEPWNTMAGAEQVAGELATLGDPVALAKLGIKGIVGAGKAIGKGVSSAGKFVGNPLPIRAATKDLTPLEEKLIQMKQKGELTEQQYNEAKSKAYSVTGKKTPEGLILKKNQAQYNLDQANQIPETAPNLTESPISPEQLQQAKESAEAAKQQNFIAKAQAEGDVQSSNPHTINNKLALARQSIEDLESSYREHPPTSWEEYHAIQEKLDNAHKAYDQAKTEAEVNPGVGTSSPNIMQKKINENQQKADQLLQDLKSHPETHPGNIEQSQADLDSAKKLHEDSNKNIHAVEKNINEHLNHKLQHDVRMAKEIFPIADAERKVLSTRFKDLDSRFEKIEVPVDNTKDINEKISEASSLIKDEKTNTPEMELVLKQLHDLISQKPHNGKDYLHAIQSVKDYAEAARKKAYSYNINKEDRNAAMARFDRLEDVVDEMSKALENAVGPENAKELKEINTGWRERVKPLQKNPIYQKIRFKRQMPANVIHELRGDEDKGNNIIKEIIQSKPEILKNAVGQRLKGNIKNIDTEQETMKEYLDKMPELKDMLEQHRHASKQAEESKEALSHAEKLHKDAVAQKKYHDELESLKKDTEIKLSGTKKSINLLQEFKDKVDKAAANRAETSKTHSAIQEQKSRAEKEETEVSKHNEKVRKQINEIHNNIPVLEKHLSNVEKTILESQLANKHYKEMEKKSNDHAKWQQKIIDSHEKTKRDLQNSKESLERIIKQVDEILPVLEESRENHLATKKEIKAINKAFSEGTLAKNKAQAKLMKTIKYISYLGLGSLGSTGIYKGISYLFSK